MNDIYLHLLALAAGIILSIIYFVGLWYTVKNIGKMRRPHVVIAASFLARISIVLLGFYFVLLFNWSYLLLAFLAFIVTRQIIINKIGETSKLLYG